MGFNTLRTLFLTVPGVLCLLAGAGLMFAGARWNRRLVRSARARDPTPGLQLDLTAISSRVSALASVRHVDVSRHWPDGVLIQVTERTPVAVVQVGGTFHAMDADGVLFRDYPRPPLGMPRVVSTADTGSAALAEAARVIASLPHDLAARVDHVQVQGIDQISLAMRSGATVIWGSDAQSALKAEVLARLLPHPAGTYDVSVPGQPVTSVH